jgi:hypothetical protein
VFRNGKQVGVTTTTSYADSCLAANTTNTYSISAFDAAGNASAQTAGVAATTLTTGTPTALAVLANSMLSGEWVPFTMGGLDLSIVTAASASVPSILTFAARGVWDCGHKKLQFVGTSHTGGVVIAGSGGLATWDDATNQWTRETYDWNSANPGHAYYHLAVNPNTGDLYFRIYFSPAIMRRAFGATGQSSWQTGQVANQPNNANQVAGGLEWFPQLNGGTGGLVFVDALGASWSNATLTSWSSTQTLVSGNYQNWIARAGGFVYWGGGSVVNTTAMYRMDPTGAAVQMPNTPLPVGVNSDPAIILSHPNGTDLLLFGTNAGDPIYRFSGGTWSNIGTHQIGAQFWVGFTIPDYGVILFLRQVDGVGTPSAIVYKP